MFADYFLSLSGNAIAIDGADFEVQHMLDVADFEFRRIGIDCLDRGVSAFRPAGDRSRVVR